MKKLITLLLLIFCFNAKSQISTATMIQNINDTVVQNTTHQITGTKLNNILKTIISYINGHASSDTTSLSNRINQKISGSGTANYLPKFTGSGSVGNSWIYQTPNNIFITNTKTLSSPDSTNTIRIWNSGSTYTTNATMRLNYHDLELSGVSTKLLGETANKLIFLNGAKKITPIYLGSGLLLTDSTLSATGAGTVTSVSGTTNRITSTGGTTPVIDISASYIGQSSITTLGTIGTGTWQGTAIGDTYISSAATWNAKAAYTDTLKFMHKLYSVTETVTGNKTFSGSNAYGVASATSLALTGTSGAGFIELPTQASNPSSPSSGTRLFSNSNSKFSWRGSANSFVKTFDGSAATADRVYSLPDVSGTIITTGDVGTVTNTMLANTFEVPLTFSTGLTRSTNTITANLAVGVSGGQTIIGGTGTGDGLTYKSTTANGTGTTAAHTFVGQNNGGTEICRFLNNGTVLFGATSLIGSENFSFQKNSNAITGLFVSNTTSGTIGKSQIAALVSGTVGCQINAHSSGFTTSGISVADASSLVSNQTAGFNMGTSSNAQTSLWTNNTERARILSSGEFIIGGTTLISSEILSIQKNQNLSTGLFVSNTTSGTAGSSQMGVIINGGVGLNHNACSAGFTTSGMLVANTAVSRSGMTGGYNIGTTSNAQVSLWANNTQYISLTPTGRTFFGGSTTATALIHLAAGTASASTAPLKFTSGTVLTTAETGAVEYNGTNLFFTRTGTTRENVLTTGSVNSVSPTSPNRTITVVIDGTTYYISAKTTND